MEFQIICFGYRIQIEELRGFEILIQFQNPNILWCQMLDLELKAPIKIQHLQFHATKQSPKTFIVNGISLSCPGKFDFQYRHHMQ